MIGRVLARVGLILLFIYVLALGGTFNGVVQPLPRLIGAIGLGLLAAAWLIGRFWQQRAGRASPVQDDHDLSLIDVAILLGIAAIALSFALNLDVWRRSAMGVWFVGLYIAVWYTLSDLIARRILSRRSIFDALLIAGVVIIAFGYLQLRSWAIFDLPRALAGALDFNPPRPVSTFGNPNSLAAFLVMLLPLIVARGIDARRAGRIALTLYFVLAGGLLVLTTSRGGWIGAAAGVLAVGGVVLLGDWRGWWARVGRIMRAVVLIFGVSAIAAIIGAVIVSLGWGGRSLNTRTWIYDAAWQTFAAQPVAGSGLYTFGRDLARYYAMPTYEPHAHAHNIVLHVAAELGIVGVIALAVPVLALARALMRTVRAADVADRGMVLGALGAGVGFLVHHLFDVPAMLPAIPLMLIVILAAGIIVPARADTPATAPRRAPIFAVAFLWIALITSGVWSALIYNRYWDAVRINAPVGRYIDAATALNSVIAADPNQPAYLYTQGMLLALSDERSAESAAAFARFTALEPDYALGWVNLAAMRAAAGDAAGALTAWATAADHGNQSWSIQYRWGEYAELQAEVIMARGAYMRALTVNPDARLHPAWDDSAIRRELGADAPPLTGAGAALTRLFAGDAEGAFAIWNDSRFRAEPPSLTVRYSLDALIAAERGDIDGARALLERGRAAAFLREDRAWIALIEARLGLGGLDSVRARLQVGDLEADWESGANIFYGQMLSLVIPRVFVPQAQIDTPYTGALLEAAVEWLIERKEESS